MQTLKECLYKTAHRNKKPVKLIADETGISENYLYRACLPNDQSGVKFPVEYLIPLMKATGDYTILSHLATVAGFILVKTPKFRNLKGESSEILDEYQESTINALKALKDFFKSPTKAGKDAVDEALVKVMEQSQAAKKYTDKYYTGQPELF